MRFDEKSRIITISTYELTAFSLLHYVGSVPSEALSPCRRVDRATLSSLGFASPLPLSRPFLSGEYSFLLEGEADELKKEGDTLSLTVVFSIDEDPEAPSPEVVKAARGEAYLLAAMAEPKRGMLLTIGYYHAPTGRCSFVKEAPKKAALSRFFERAAEAVFLYAGPEIARVCHRLPAMRRLRFPYREARLGQEILMKEVYRVASRGGSLFACAPTGIGKTVSTLFPAVHAMGEGKCDKIFYLTGKNTAATAAAEAAALLGRGGALRTVVLTAKERLCPNRLLCRADSRCGRARSGGKVEAAALSLVAEEKVLITPDKIAAKAKEYGVCPHELSLDVSLFCDVIVGDYNYLFDPMVRLKRYFSAKGRWLFLVDEAHNLPDRLREMYDGELSLAALSSCYEALVAEEDKGKLARALDLAIRYFREAIAPLGRDGEKTGGERAEVGNFYRELPEGLHPVLSELYIALEKRVRRKEGISPSLRKFLRDFKQELKRILCILTEYGEGFRLLCAVDDRGNARIRTLCLDTATPARHALSLGGGAVFFSATLHPLSFYRDLLGGDVSSPLVEVPSPFDRENLSIAVLDKISTRYTDRADSLFEVAEAIRVTVEARRGNYMVFCPSFPYMESLLPVFSSLCKDVRVQAQGRYMKQEERRAFLRAFEDTGEPVVAFCVLGGIYGEAVDLLGDRLIGAVIVGVGMPFPDLLREQIALYFRDKSENGMEYAYVYPGMNRVLQAAGRVIRSENDRGAVVLIDDRFSSPLYRAIFPSHWHSLHYVGNNRSLRELLRRFWERHPQ